MFLATVLVPEGCLCLQASQFAAKQAAAALNTSSDAQAACGGLPASEENMSHC